MRAPRRVPIWRRALCGAAIFLGGASAGVAGAIAAGEQPSAAAAVAWFQFPPDCPIVPARIVPGDGEEPQTVDCGGAGSFLFGKQGLAYQGGNCGAPHGSEVPSVLQAEPVPPLPATFPCAAGRCLGQAAGRPWVAILDWPAEHGWSVAATVREASDQRVAVQLYDLTAAGVAGNWVPHVSDLHVLIQLCALAEDVQGDPGARPLAVNLSFGRRAAGDCASSGLGLGCAVGGVLSYLMEKEGIPVVAAAGNDGELLFPAASPGVISAGALDLSHFRYSGEPRASTQTPPAAAALMPGYGLYLTLDGGNTEWAAPPGSSYAAALLSGWLGGTLALADTSPGPLVTPGARWTPLPTANGLALALDGVPLPGSELQGPRLLLDRALGVAPISLQPKGSTAAILRLKGPAPTWPGRSLLYAEDGNGPLPGVDPCVPCRGNGAGGDGSDPANVIVDLSSSGVLPPQMELAAVWLRVGKGLYAFDGSEDPALLSALAAGALDSVTLTGVHGLFADEQPSLTLEIRAGGSIYWHEIPIHLRP